MQLQFFGKWNKEEIRQLEVNDLVWIVDENVTRAHYKMGRVLEVYHGCDGRVRSALVKTEDGKLKRRKCFSGEKQGRQCWRQASAGNETRFGTCRLRNKTYTPKKLDEILKKSQSL